MVKPNPIRGHDPEPAVAVMLADDVFYASAGRYVAGTALPLHTVTGQSNGRITASLDTPMLAQLKAPGRAILAVTVESDEGPRLFGLDSRRVRQRAAATDGGAKLAVPAAYEIDDFAMAIMWAVATYDATLTDDDAGLAQALRSFQVYESLGSSTVTGATVTDLSTASRMWLGSRFCAEHINRNAGVLTERPDFWTREQRGEEASVWLTFTHKLDYLRTYAAEKYDQIPRRAFCVPTTAVTDSTHLERILFFLAASLMESFGIVVDIITESEYTAMPGFVTDQTAHAIVATWIGADGLWHVDLPTTRPTLREFADALGDANHHSAIAGSTPAARLYALAGFLGLDWEWVTRRCAELGEYGTAGLIQPRSRLMSAEGIDRACQFAAATAAPAR